MAMTLRLDEDTQAALNGLAQAEGISKQEAVVRAIREASARRAHVSDVAKASAKARARYGAVLARLGE